MRTAGLEPALPLGKQILSLLRIPFRHVRNPVLHQELIMHHRVDFSPYDVAIDCNILQAFSPISKISRPFRATWLQHDGQSERLPELGSE